MERSGRRAALKSLKVGVPMLAEPYHGKMGQDFMAAGRSILFRSDASRTMGVYFDRAWYQGMENQSWKNSTYNFLAWAGNLCIMSAKDSISLGGGV